MYLSYQNERRPIRLVQEKNSHVSAVTYLSRSSLGRWLYSCKEATAATASARPHYYTGTGAYTGTGPHASRYYCASCSCYPGSG